MLLFSRRHYRISSLYFTVRLGGHCVVSHSLYLCVVSHSRSLMLKHLYAKGCFNSAPTPTDASPSMSTPSMSLTHLMKCNKLYINMSYLCFPSAPLHFLDVEDYIGKIECYDFVYFRKHFRIICLPPFDVLYNIMK